MKLIQANPKSDNERTIISTLNSKEKLIRDKGTSFYKEKGKWKHVKFNGWVTITEAPNNILFAKIQSKIPAQEAKIFEAFVGYITRHCGHLIDSLTIYYR